MRKMSSEMCASKGSALLSGAQKHLIEITFKLRKRKSDDSSQTPQRGHTLRKSKERNILPQKYGVKGTKAPAHLCVCVVVCLIISVASLSLSLHISLTQTREEQRERSLSGERGIKAKRAAHSVGGGVRKEEYKIDFPERNKNIKKWIWGSETELYLRVWHDLDSPRLLYLPRLRQIRRRLRRPRSPGGARVRESDTFPRRR